jgi:hypothetical protein
MQKQCQKPEYDRMARLFCYKNVSVALFGNQVFVVGLDFFAQTGNVYVNGAVQYV